MSGFPLAILWGQCLHLPGSDSIVIIFSFGFAIRVDQSRYMCAPIHPHARRYYTRSALQLLIPRTGRTHLMEKPLIIPTSSSMSARGIRDLGRDRFSKSEVVIQ